MSLRYIFLVLAFLSFHGCDNKITNQAQDSRKELLIYCGITMVNPITEIANIVEQTKGIRVRISQGGSQDHYDTLKHGKVGDIYFPGSSDFIDKNRNDGFFEKEVFVGYNKAVFVVQKGNPKNIKPTLDEMKSKELRVIISSPKTGSIGKETENILSKANIYNDVLDNAIYVATDSRHITEYILDDKADLAINWKASVISNNAQNRIDTLNLDENVAKKHNLYLVLLSFSKNRELAQYFLDVASSKKGREIFKKHGFLDATDF